MSRVRSASIRLLFAFRFGLSVAGAMVPFAWSIARAQDTPAPLPPGFTMPPGPPPNYVPPAPPNYVPGAPPPVQAPSIPPELLHPPVQAGNGYPTSPSASNSNPGGADMSAPTAPGYAPYPPNQAYPPGQPNGTDEATTQPAAPDTGTTPPGTEEAGQPNPAPTPVQMVARPPELSGPLGATQEKINFPLLAASRTYRATPHDSGSARMAMNIGGVSIDASGKTGVEIKATSQDAVLEKITSIGGSVTNASTNDGLIHARIPIDKVEELAAMDSVKYVGTAGPEYAPARVIGLSPQQSARTGTSGGVGSTASKPNE